MSAPTTVALSVRMVTCIRTPFLDSKAMKTIYLAPGLTVTDAEGAKGTIIAHRFEYNAGFGIEMTIVEINWADGTQTGHALTEFEQYGGELKIDEKKT
jgi:hypothetical protein